MNPSAKPSAMEYDSGMPISVRNAGTDSMPAFQSIFVTFRIIIAPATRLRQSRTPGRDFPRLTPISPCIGAGLFALDECRFTS